ncbi:MAG: YeeE/YedE family protein [Geminicoccaceae bacterium]
MTEFTPVASLFGGVLIGISAMLLWLLTGRIAGMSGIFQAAVFGGEVRNERIAFLLGLLFAPVLLVLSGIDVTIQVPSPLWLLLLGGVVVGIGVTYGSGCTSGHGVCGLARRSPRSLVATLTFMATAALTVLVVKSLWIPL